MKKALSLTLSLLMLLSLFFLIGCGGEKEEKVSADDALKINWWIPVGEDSTYYASYEENPAVRYFETKKYNGRKIDLSFQVPVAGAELDNFNTLLATEDYAMIMDMQYSTTSASELYADGLIYDLTDYVEQYMPNYMKAINEHPESKQLLYNNVNGEQRILTVCSITNEVLNNFMGWLYRRDWVAKYGTNPQTGAAFTYGKDENGLWTDDVVFPSGGSDPIYISDWEWMFEIFDKARADLGITDGYNISVMYKGYHEDGGLYTAFGGGAPLWYQDKEGNAAFGGADESMRAYLQCLNNWYNKGWLDPQFAERTGDQAYAINTSGSHAGKVGMFIGRRAETGDLLEDPEMPLTQGIMMYGAYQPINDVYGGEAVKNKTPYSMYQYSHVRSNHVITNKVSEEDLPTVLAFLDYLYTTDGALKLCFGLTEEEVDEIQDPTYAKFNLEYGYKTDGVDENGIPIYIRNEGTKEDNNLASAVAGKRMTIGLYDWGFVPALNTSYTQYARQAMAAWDHYLNTGFIDKSAKAQFSVEESNSYNKVWANVDTFMSTNIPKFIKGILDVNNEADWGDYVKMLNKYSPDKIVKSYQRVFYVYK